MEAGMDAIDLGESKRPSSPVGLLFGAPAVLARKAGAFFVLVKAC
jgi:hypothetical protein